jgi:type II secretory pathway pseudopilin PulG
MLELIIVIVVAGILAAVMIPRLERDNLREAANQVVRHIQYTQHLAMVDDIYDATDATWFRERWKIQFNKRVGGSDDQWAYIVYRDINQDRTPDVNEIALDPMNSSQALTGGFSNATIKYGDEKASNKMNIGHAYGILDVDFIAGCNIPNDTQNKQISFDSLGRPYKNRTDNLLTPFGTTAINTNRVISNQCIIELCKVTNCTTASASEKIQIAIEPETGYVHIL